MNNLKTIENTLVPVYETDTGEKVVYGTELHDSLEVKSNYREWAGRRFAECDAVENTDYTSVEISTLSGGSKKKIHIIKLDTAKEMAMLERNEKGKEVRRYFIDVEKRYKVDSTLPKSKSKRPALGSVNVAAKNLMAVYEAAGVDPRFTALAVTELYREKADISLIPPIQAEPAEMIYDKTTIARLLGIMSLTNEPHAQAVGAIVNRIEITDDEKVKVPYSRRGHSGFNYQYKPSVITKIKGWIKDNQYPTQIQGNGKSYKVIYAAV